MPFRVSRIFCVAKKLRQSSIINRYDGMQITNQSAANIRDNDPVTNKHGTILSGAFRSLNKQIETRMTSRSVSMLNVNGDSHRHTAPILEGSAKCCKHIRRDRFGSPLCKRSSRVRLQRNLRLRRVFRNRPFGQVQQRLNVFPDGVSGLIDNA